MIMKRKISILILAAIIISALSLRVMAEEGETAQNMSAVRIMITSVETEKDYITPGEECRVSVTVKNTNSYKSVRNAVFTLTDSSNELVPGGTGTEYVSYISPWDEYTWETTVTAVNTASEGRHSLTFSAEYEDLYYAAFSDSEEIYLNVRQPVSFDYSGAQLPARIAQNETATMSVTLMNTGKSVLSNVKTETKIPGLETGGAVFSGDILPGESKNITVNLRAVKEEPGDVSGEIGFSYEDCFGEKYTKTVKLSSTVTEKIPVTETEEKEKPTDKIAWWLWIIIGAVPSAAIAAIIPVAVYSSKNRKRDEAML